MATQIVTASQTY